MTSQSNTSQLKLALDKVAEVLTQENVQDLTFVCEDISPEERDTITNTGELFDALEYHNLLKDHKINAVIFWLDQLGLSQASEFLKEYRKTHVKENENAQTRCFIHEDQVFKCFCLSCNTKVCPDCAVSAHIQLLNCDVINLSTISEEISKRRQKLSKEKENVKVKAEYVKELWKFKEQFVAKCREQARSRILLDSSSLEKIVQERKQKLIERVEMTRRDRDLPKETPEKNTQNPLYKRVPNDGAFGSVEESILIGIVVVPGKILVHIYDERKNNGKVVLRCFTSDDNSKDILREEVTIDNHIDPVVMSNITMYHGSVDHVLFAVGNEVFDLSPQMPVSLSGFRLSVSKLVIQEVPRGSWITSMTAHFPDNNFNSEFAISTSFDHKIREYKISGSALRTIDIQEQVPFKFIYKVAYCRNIFALLFRGRKDVILVDATATVKQFGTLSLPSSITGVLPINIIWTGSTWLVLYVSYGNDNKWKVVQYERTGKFLNVCNEGTSSYQMDVLISITRWGNDGYGVSANLNFLMFEI
ncbi:uncharacterized protein [Apostichopus japonicus]|uniref:uncharacterized protein n=1 Tax=Stichopus japonicus TaxID=307972 RepID=UPI003AB1FEA3